MPFGKFGVIVALTTTPNSGSTYSHEFSTSWTFGGPFEHPRTIELEEGPVIKATQATAMVCIVASTEKLKRHAARVSRITMGLAP